MGKVYNILTVEDSEPDFILLKKALLRMQELTVVIENVTNGQEAIDYVFKNGKYATAATPDLIILDLNLPIKNGMDVLKTIKSDQFKKLIPIVVYTTSEEMSDINCSYSLYANSYITKSSEIKDIYQKISTMGEFWLKTSQLPNIDHSCPII
jgi:CheY-like chemotaxis protein